MGQVLATGESFAAELPADDCDGLRFSYADLRADVADGDAGEGQGNDVSVSGISVLGAVARG